MKEVVIVGAGVAGLSAAAELREQGWDGHLTIIGDETHRPYRRPPLSKDYLSPGIPESVAIPQADDLDATWLLGLPATGLDLDARTVLRGSSDPVRFDGLVIATGAHARQVPTNLRGIDGVLTLRGLDDADRLRAALTNDPAVLVVGAGFLGTELAATFRARGLPVTLVDRARLPMIRALGAELGSRVAELHETHRVHLKLGRNVRQLLGNGRVSHAHLDDGTAVRAELVVVATGSEPTTGWLLSSGLAITSGLLVDSSGVASPGIVAAGDVASLRHPLIPGSPVRIEHFANAAEQGTRAAQALLELKPRRPMPVPSFWSHFYHWRLQSVGFTGDSFAYQTVETGPGEQFVGEFRHDGRLVGAVANNNPAAIVKYRRRLQVEME